EDSLSVYIVPMRGQVGTDILPELYEPIIEDIKAEDPDMVIIKIDSHDWKDIDDEVVDIMNQSGRPGREDISTVQLKPMAEIREAFAQELPDVEQVCYVEDAMSAASLLALSWEELYMDPDADFGGAVIVWVQWLFPVAGDPQKYGKYTRATMGDVRGLVQFGGWDTPDRRAFIQAFVIPEAMASTTWRGREAIWFDHTGGEFPVDERGELPRKISWEFLQNPPTITLTGREAEQLLVADGTAESETFVQDILASLGYRRYHIVGTASEPVEKHRKKWSAAADRAKASFRKYGRMAQGGAIWQIQAAVKALQSYMSAIRSNKAVKTRMQIEGLPTDRIKLEIMLEDLKERIRQLSGNGRRGGRGGGGAGGGPGGM
ncbi:MAG: hypothetical protein QGG74_01665, partial [Phycisphaerales bacterium]|nr:hypothetical protein [Phycisphaerales bacterium]